VTSPAPTGAQADGAAAGGVVRPTAADARRWVEADFGFPVRTVEEVDGGSDPAAVVWRLVDDDGAAWAVKWTTRPTRTGSRLVGSMSDAGLPHAPQTASTLDGRRRSRRRGGKLSVVRWSDGEDAATLGLDLDGWRVYGALLADVHAHPFPAPERRQGARRGIRRRRRRYRAEARALDALAAGARPADGGDGDDVRRLVLDLWREARPRVALLFRGAGLPSGAAAERVPCHGDPHLGNVLVEPDGDLRLIDWDEAVVAPRELDLHLVEFSVLFRPATAAELDAFRSGYGPARLDEARLVRYACVRALEDLTSSGTVALGTPGAERDDALRVFRGVLSPLGSASLVGPRLGRLLDAADEQR
jgi:spectinomycin phosphotransferase